MSSQMKVGKDHYWAFIGHWKGFKFWSESDWKLPKDMEQEDDTQFTFFKRLSGWCNKTKWE